MHGWVTFALWYPHYMLDFEVAKCFYSVLDLVTSVIGKVVGKIGNRLSMSDRFRVQLRKISLVRLQASGHLLTGIAQVSSCIRGEQRMDAGTVS